MSHPNVMCDPTGGEQVGDPVNAQTNLVTQLYRRQAGTNRRKGLWILFSRQLAQSNVVIHLQIMTAHADDYAERQGAIRAVGFVDVSLATRVYISVKAERSFQQGPVAVTFGALYVESQ
jgi:hypothetical protein